MTIGTLYSKQIRTKETCHFKVHDMDKKVRQYREQTIRWMFSMN